MAKYGFSDLADIPKLQELMGSLYWLTNVAMGIIEADGTFLFCDGWRNVCTSATSGPCNCQASIADNLDPRSYTCYRCPTGMLHYVSPIVVEGEHLASVYIGQFFTEPPDEVSVSLHAVQRGLPPAQYYNDLKKIAVIPPMNLTLLLKYLHDLANMLADIGLQRLKQMEALRQLRENEERLQYISRHDPLTGLLNRNSFEEAMATFKKTQELPFAIMVFDLDGLKLINDSLGHVSGDALLLTAADLIRGTAPPGALAYRIGGDEFSLLLPHTDQDSVAKIRRLLQTKIEHHNQNNVTLTLGISVGFAIAASLPFKPRDLFMEADTNMYKEKLRHGQAAFSSGLDSVMRLLRLRDYVDDGHTDRLSTMSAALAKKLDFSPRQLDELELLTHFHDIGKTALPETLLKKPSILTSEERRIMHRHCEIGHRMALSFSELTPIAEYILKHHEWWNGNGYPLGIAGEDIPIHSRILSIVDAFDAMTSERPYRSTKNLDEAVTELRQSSGKQFDPFLVELFIEWLGCENN